MAAARKTTEEPTPAGGQLETLTEVSNSAEPDIVVGAPYIATVMLEGIAPLLFHSWSVEAVAEKAAAAKGSAAKKEDNVESYVYRNQANQICLPGEYLRMALVNAGRYRQDPRSPRKSMMDMCKAALIPLTDLAPMLVGGAPCTDWEYLDRRRVMVQRNGVTRSRPAFNAGWRAEFQIQVVLPEYVSPATLQGLLNDAGRLVGVADFRPTYGRFFVKSFAIDGD